MINMIKYNLRKNDFDNPMENKYGVITGNVAYARYPLTIVDNSKEEKDGMYTHIPALCLIHISERIRRYEHLRLFNEFLHLDFTFSTPTYKMYDYKYEELSEEQIIKDLKSVLYYFEPNLQSHSLVGCSSNEIEDDINYYEGSYVLNDEEEYTILKYKDEYKFYKGKKCYYPNWEREEDLIYSGKIDFDIYKKSIYLLDLRRQIVMFTNELLDEHDIVERITEYQTCKTELEEILELNN